MFRRLEVVSFSGIILAHSDLFRGWAGGSCGLSDATSLALSGDARLAFETRADRQNSLLLANWR